MTGLEKILAQIQSDSDNTCESIRNKTEQQCHQIIDSAKSEAQAIEADGVKSAQSQYDEIIRRAESAASLERSRIMLSAKQEIISSMLTKTAEYFCSLPDEQYFSLMYRMIGRYSEASNGVIALNRTDLDRLPADFSDKADAAAKGGLKLRPDSVGITGGFILIYGGIEVNCSFDSIFSAESERFGDAVSNLVFG